MSDTYTGSNAPPLDQHAAAASPQELGAAKRELEIYREEVQAAMEAACDPLAQEPRELIYNRSAEHAAVILEFLFRAARRHVMIVSSRLDLRVYGVPAVIAAASDFLRNNQSARLEVLIESELDTASHPWLKAVLAIDKKRVSVGRVPPALVARYKYNFAVADGQHYRIEQDRAHFDAFAQFGNRNIGSKLEVTFNSLKQAA
jgi:hypothetical protein